MPRKGPVPRREILPDPIYNSRLVARFVNRLMYNGKKGPAEAIFYRALDVLGEKSGEDALRALLAREDAVGSMPRAFDKAELFPYIRANGVLPRKTFSMGEARDKRYYLEMRRIGR